MDVTDINRLRDAIILNVLLTNVDSHSKNYALILSGRSVTFAPLYDLMCGTAWPHVTQNMAQSIAGKTPGKHIAARHWRRMAKECGINGTALLRRVEQLASHVSTRVDAAADEVRAMPAGGHPMLAEFVNAIKARCRDVTTNLRGDGPGEGADEEPEEEESLPAETSKFYLMSGFSKSCLTTRPSKIKLNITH
jgi:serine/threonine-protein kinase HipA